MRHHIILTLCLAAVAVCASAQQRTYQLTEPAQDKEIKTGHLDLGGTAPDGGSIEVNSYYVIQDGKPVIPVMGEFHYSRYPAEQWEEQILKMKSGGLTIIPTYVFWNIHEEREGEFRWDGNRNLRHFIELCAKHDMPVLVRIGPFCHGEIRNGGLPDWLFAKPVEVRSNDANYLHYVGLLYDQIAAQLQGLYYKDGGPIIGIQIENEHQHSAAPWAITYPGEPKDYTSATYDAGITMIGVSVQDKEITTAELGDLHMKTLKGMAEERGMITPLYTATGWGNAAVIGNEAIPVTSAYTYPFWAKPAMSAFCMFKDLHAHPDYEPVRYNATDYPSFCAEMGVGITHTYERRPIVTAQAAYALMVRSLGSGANGIGYYMYHGGSTPKRSDGVGFFSDEPMGVPKISYDFQAPLGEFGLEHESYRHLRLLHSFLADFGSLLAPMGTVLPEGWEKMTPDNRDDLRYAARMKDGSGFIFMVNFQDHDGSRHAMEDIALNLDLRDGSLTIPRSGGFTLPKDESLIIPFNLGMEGALLKYATAQLLMKIDDGGTPHYFFFAPDGMQPEFLFDKGSVRGKAQFNPVPGFESTFTVRSAGGQRFKVTTLTAAQALDAVKVDGKLLITPASVLASDEGVQLLQLGENDFRYVVYPSRTGLREQSLSVTPADPEFSCTKVGSRRMVFGFNRPADTPQVHEYFLRVKYTGDVAMAFSDSELILDHFWFGRPWTIALNRFQKEDGRVDMNFYFRPLSASAPFIHDIPEESLPEFNRGKALGIDSVELVPEYTVIIVL